MFTGIVEEIGVVQRVIPGEKSSRLVVEAAKVLEQTKIGDSICTSGVCLTVTHLDSRSFTADVMAETLRRSKLGMLHPGSPVNLERALRLDSRLGGHIVSGHIDGVGTITGLRREDNAVWVTVAAEEPVLRYVVEKGSIAIDGISLTVAAVSADTFQVSVIPHTGEETTLLREREGAPVNLECDMIGKYVEKLLCGPAASVPAPSSLTEAFLREHGFN